MSALESLLALLARQHALFSRLQALVQEERACLLNSELDRLEGIVQEQSALLTEQSLLSSRVLSTLEGVKTALRLDGRLSLARLAEYLDDPAQAATVRNYHRELAGMADEIQREGQVNWHLAQQALKYVDFTLKMIGRSKEGPLPYTPTAQDGPQKPVQLVMDSCA